MKTDHFQKLSKKKKAKPVLILVFLFENSENGAQRNTCGKLQPPFVDDVTRTNHFRFMLNEKSRYPAERAEESICGYCCYLKVVRPEIRDIGEFLANEHMSTKI